MATIVMASGLASLAGLGIARSKVGAGLVMVGLGVAGATLALAAMPARKARMTLLGGTLLLLTAYPLARVVVRGNIPIYVVDVLIALTLLSVLLERRREKLDWASAQPLPWLVMLFWLPSTLSSYINEVRLTEIWLETTYMLVRTLLSISIFFVIPAVVRDQRSLHLVLRCLVIGMAITAALSVIHTLLPPDHPALGFLDSLSPADLLQRQVVYRGSGNPVRARALVGSPNAIGSLIALIWPLAFGMHISGQFQRKRFVLWLILVVGVLGVVATYSRSGYLGLAFVWVMLAFQRTSGRWRVLATALLVCLLIVVASQVTGLAQLDFVIGKFASIPDTLRNPAEVRMDDGRILASANMPGFLLSHPLWLVVGRGLATYDLLHRGLIPSLASSELIFTENHSIFAITFYQRGLSAMIVLAMIWLKSFLLMHRRQSSPEPGGAGAEYDWLALSVQASLVGLAPAWLFTHYYGTTVHMQTLQFAVFGLVAMTHRFAASDPVELVDSGEG